MDSVICAQQAEQRNCVLYTLDSQVRGWVMWFCSTEEGCCLNRQSQRLWFLHIVPVHSQIPAHSPRWGWDSLLAKNTVQGGYSGPDSLIPAGLTGIKRACKDLKLRLKVHLQMRQLRDTLYSVVLAPFPPQLPHSLSSGVRFLWANLRRKAFLIRYLTDSEYVYFYIVNKISILSSLGRDFVFRDLFKALSMLLVLQV